MEKKIKKEIKEAIKFIGIFNIKINGPWTDEYLEPHIDNLYRIFQSQLENQNKLIPGFKLLPERRKLLTQAEKNHIRELQGKAA